MTKNTIAAVVLSVAFLILWNRFYRPAVVTTPHANNNSVADSNSQRSSNAKEPKSSGDLLTTKKSAAHAPELKEKTFVIESENARITFTSSGGAIKKYELKNASPKTANQVPSGQKEGQKEYFNLIPSDDGEGIFATRQINGAELSEARIFVKPANNPDVVISEQTSLSSNSGNNGKYIVRKIYRLAAHTTGKESGATSYLEGLDIEVISIDKKSTSGTIKNPAILNMILSKGLAENSFSSANNEKENISLNSVKYLPPVGKKVYRLKSGEISLISEQDNTSARWVASDNRYYISAMIPLEDGGKSFLAGDKLEVKRLSKNSYPLAQISLAITPDSVTRRFKIYIGGKSFQTLKQTAPYLEKTIDFGLMGGLGKFFLESLIFIKKFTNNYGWAIVILSLAIQIITLPLSLKSLKATADMKRLQPLMREIQTKYKDDPRRMNVEMMNLYKTHKVNPLSGCLPMLLQMPIFWALFTTLRNAYELKNAGWILWIKDLSAHDPFYVLPILMGLGMFGQQFMSGATQDPQNKMMGYIFPAVFTFMFLKFPSGVVLYWLINSILTISIQFFFLEKETIKEHRQITTAG